MSMDQMEPIQGVENTMKVKASKWVYNKQGQGHNHTVIKCDCGATFERCNESCSVQCPICKMRCEHKNTHQDACSIRNNVWCEDCGFLVHQDSDYSYWPGEEHIPACDTTIEHKE